MKAVLRSEKDHVPYIAIFSEKGGAGKSTTSALIAYAFADFGRKSVALAEVNPHRGTLPDKMGTSTERCLVNLISDINNAEDVDDVDPRAYMPQVDGLSINVLAGNVANGPRRYTTTAHDVVQVCTNLSKVWPLVILDNGTDIEDRGSSWEDKSAAYGSFAVASSLILVTNPDLRSQRGLLHPLWNCWNQRLMTPTSMRLSGGSGGISGNLWFWQLLTKPTPTPRNWRQKVMVLSLAQMMHLRFTTTSNQRSEVLSSFLMTLHW